MKNKAQKASIEAIEGTKSVALQEEANKLIKAFVGEVFDGHLTYTDNHFKSYKDGIWVSVPDLQVSRKLYNYTDNKLSTPKARELIERIKILQCYEKDRFPAPDQNYLILSNGAYCLSTHTLEEYSPQHHGRNKLPFEYDAKASCPNWLANLTEKFGDGEDAKLKIRALQEFMGYTMTSSTKYEKCIWLYGDGRNGKSTIMNSFKSMLSTENYSALTLDDLSHQFRAANILEKNANFCEEIPVNHKLKEDMFKRSVSGSESIFEQKNKAPTMAKPYAKLWFASNHLPKSSDESEALTRRLIIIHFDRQIAPSDVKVGFEALFEAEFPGIFNWAMEGLKRLDVQGAFTEPQSSANLIKQINSKYSSFDMYLQWLKRLPDSVPDTHAPRSSEVFDAYMQFCELHQLTAISNSCFGKAIREHFEVTRKSNGYYKYRVKMLPYN